MTARKIILDPAVEPALGAADVANDAARVTRYRALIQEGLEDLDAGRFEVVEDIDAWLDTQGRRPPA